MKLALKHMWMFISAFLASLIIVQVCIAMEPCVEYRHLLDDENVIISTILTKRVSDDLREGLFITPEKLRISLIDLKESVSIYLIQLTAFFSDSDILRYYNADAIEMLRWSKTRAEELLVRLNSFEEKWYPKPE
jgi:hypothetical protein